MKEFEGKKILVLGGSKNLVPLINMGHSLGYYVIVCDWTKDNPGNLIADKHYQVSVCDFDVILNIAKEERIDGICSNYEVAMPTVAYVSEKLNLVGNPYKSIVNVIEKDKFRNLQKRAGVFAPKHIVTCSYEYLKKKIKEFEFPVILKPCESSATRGVTKILKNDLTTIKEAFLSCQSLSRNNKVCLEEFVEMQSLVVLDGDVFVYGDDFIWNGLFYSTRSKNAPMVPTTQTYPLSLPEEKLNIVKDTLKKVFKTAGIRFGEYNVEMYFNRGGGIIHHRDKCKARRKWNSNHDKRTFWN